MKQKTKNTDTDELTTDDEILRIKGMEDGPKQVAGRELRPISALTLSWMQRNKFFGEGRDLIWKCAAFMFLHSEPIPKVRSVVNDNDAFMITVDQWIEKNILHRDDVQTLSKAMDEAFELYMSASTHSQGNSAGN
jgi:hypothetical protein